MVIGFDGGDDALEAIEKGEMTATVAQQPDVIGQLGVELADKIAKGETVEKEVAAELKIVSNTDAKAVKEDEKATDGVEGVVEDVKDEVEKGVDTVKDDVEGAVDDVKDDVESKS